MSDEHAPHEPQETGAYADPDPPGLTTFYVIGVITLCVVVTILLVQFLYYHSAAQETLRKEQRFPERELIWQTQAQRLSQAPLPIDRAIEQVVTRLR